MYQNVILFERTQHLLIVLFEVQFAYNFALNDSLKKAVVYTVVDKYHFFLIGLNS